MEETNKLKLPFLSQSQAQKEITLNEALNLLDFFVQPTVLAAQTDPPATAVDGDAYIINGIGSGAWAGKNNCVAIRTNGYWGYLTPFVGMSFFSVADSIVFLYKKGAWQYFDKSNEIVNEIASLNSRIDEIEASGGGVVYTKLITYSGFNTSSSISTSAYAIKGTTFVATQNISLYGITYDISAAAVGDKYKFMIFELDGNTSTVLSVVYDSTEYVAAETFRVKVSVMLTIPVNIIKGKYYGFAIVLTSGSGTSSCRCYFDNGVGTPIIPGLSQIAWFRGNNATDIVAGQVINDYITSSQTFIGCGVYIDFAELFQ